MTSSPAPSLPARTWNISCIHGCATPLFPSSGISVAVQVAPSRSRQLCASRRLMRSMITMAVTSEGRAESRFPIGTSGDTLLSGLSSAKKDAGSASAMVWISPPQSGTSDRDPVALKTLFPVPSAARPIAEKTSCSGISRTAAAEVAAVRHPVLPEVWSRHFF